MLQDTKIKLSQIENNKYNDLNKIRHVWVAVSQFSANYSSKQLIKMIGNVVKPVRSYIVPLLSPKCCELMMKMSKHNCSPLVNQSGLKTLTHDLYDGIFTRYDYYYKQYINTLNAK